MIIPATSGSVPVGYRLCTEFPSPPRSCDQTASDVDCLTNVAFRTCLIVLFCFRPEAPGPVTGISRARLNNQGTGHIFRLNCQTAKRRCQRKSRAAASDDNQLIVTVRLIRAIGLHRASPSDEHADPTDGARKFLRTGQTAARGKRPGPFSVTQRMRAPR